MKPLSFEATQWDITPEVAATSTTDKYLTIADLSPDQRAVYDDMTTWSQGSGRTEILTIGGYAGCLSGDTVLGYNRGARANTRPITLKDLYLKFNGFAGSGRGVAQRWVDLTLPTYLESMWPDGTVALNRVIGVLESGVKKVIRVEFSDGSFLVLTEDHPVAIPGGEFIAAGSLHVDDHVLGRGSMRPASEGKGRRPFSQRPPRVIVNTKYHPIGSFKAVECNGVVYEYMRVSRARLVVEAAMNEIDYDEFVHALKHNKGASKKFKFLPRGVDVHHVDEDTMNDDISNLEVLPHAEHARIHTEERNQENVEYTREVEITSIEPAGEEMTYDIQMEPPANNFVANGIIVHNTGKSSILGVFAHETTKLVAFVAFTGRAASVLKRKLGACDVPTTNLLLARGGKNGEENPIAGYSYSSLDPQMDLPFCGTIHRLLYKPVVNVATEEITGWTKREELDRDYGLIVIDEASMVGDEMLADLQRHGVPIMAVGDHGQLPPVMSKGSLMANPMLKLEKIHRQAEGSPIIQLSKAIREQGRFDYELECETLQFKNKKNIEGVLGEAYEKDSPLDVGALCWMNKNRVLLNAKARKVLGYSGPPAENEIILWLKNVPPVYNGMRGILAADSIQQKPAWRLSIEASFPEEGISTLRYLVCSAQFHRDKTFASIEELQERGIDAKKMSDAGNLADFGYALTVHKSQGSSFKHAVVYMDMGREKDEWRRWTYTAVTRASERLTVLV